MPDPALSPPLGSRHEGRVFAVTMAGGFLFVAAIAYWREAQTVAYVAVVLAAVSLLAGVLVPGRLDPTRRGWMKLGELLGRITTPILIAIVYFAVVTPIALVRKLVGARRQATSGSSWHRRLPLPPPERLERQF